MDRGIFFTSGAFYCDQVFEKYVEGSMRGSAKVQTRCDDIPPHPPPPLLSSTVCPKRLCLQVLARMLYASRMKIVAVRHRRGPAASSSCCCGVCCCCTCARPPTSTARVRCARVTASCGASWPGVRVPRPRSRFTSGCPTPHRPWARCDSCRRSLRRPGAVPV